MAKKSSKVAKSDVSAEKSDASPAKAGAKAGEMSTKPASLAPVVNLSLAAQSAALSLAARKARAAADDSAGGAVNAAAFKNLKSGLTQAQHAPTSPLAGLNKPAKPTGSAGYNRVGGHHQQNGPNVARTGVPRRTGGG